ncbi:MAG: DCC1-like thiol-disulfide oxidoreductase family protein, partial [Bacteroidota bacterium]
VMTGKPARKVAQKAMIYDDQCPVCAWYTKTFVRVGLLQPENRVAFGELDTRYPEVDLDRDRARHEIPLVDLAGGPTLYGLDSLVFILGQRAPWIPLLLKFPPLYAFFKALYSLVSYNRRVITGKTAICSTDTCQPDFHAFYRWVFIALAAGVATAISHAFGRPVAAVLHGYGVAMTPFAFVLMVGAGWLLDAVSAAMYLPAQRVTYFGHLAANMLIGVLLLLPGLLITALLGYAEPVVLMVSVGFSFAMMLMQYHRRARAMGLAFTWTIMWVAHLVGGAALVGYFLNLY